MNSECVGYCLSKSIDFELFLKKYSDEYKKHRECILINYYESDIFVFPYGSVVVWGEIPKKEVQELLKPYLVEEFSDLSFFDEFDVKYEAEKTYIKEDTIYFDRDEEYLKLSYSHVIAQSLKLSSIETEIQESINKVQSIPQDLANKGKITTSKKEISTLRGELYLLKSHVNLDYALLDKPEFFWEYPEYDSYYNKMAIYLELDQRTYILNKRMNIIDEILGILADELNHRHSSRLEWIIIWLIAIEIVIFFVHDLFKWV